VREVKDRSTGTCTFYDTSTLVLKRQTPHINYKNKGRRLKRSARIILKGIVFFVVAFFLFLFVKSLLPEKSKSGTGKTGIENFRDLNEVHLRYARKKGISPFKSSKELHQRSVNLLKNGDLVKLNSSDYYVIDRLTHSHPYLVPEAADLLEEIGRRFQAKLTQHGKDKLYFKVTSLLRTGESQQKLSRSNGNASPNSAHLYATTFDITYKALVRKNLFGRKKEVSDQVALHFLSETLGELRKEKKLVIVTEKKEACFHITVR